MKVTELISINQFQTAEKVYMVVRIYEETKMDLREIMQSLDKSNFMGIREKDTVFVLRLFEYLVDKYSSMQEAFLELFFDYIQKGWDPLGALNATSNYIILGEDVCM